MNLDLTFQAARIYQQRIAHGSRYRQNCISTRSYRKGARDDVDSDAGSNGTNENAIYPNQTSDDNITSITDTGREVKMITIQQASILTEHLRKTVATAGPYTHMDKKLILELQFSIKSFQQTM
ncbi:MAG: hypothetical protein IPL98_13170 [Saprospiraceae bacterium]|nr:hypothetical protein [Saprospiraceae bacterium]